MTLRGLDHLVHLVRDLGAVAETYARLGFTVGRENLHPFGTKNRIVQLPGFFIELLAIGDHAPIPDHGARRFSFAAFHRDLLARAGEGGSALAFESHDAKDDAAAFRAAGFGDLDTFAFERRGVGPDGAPVDVGFELAFALDPAIPDACLFACAHKRPENFWSEVAQVHANGARGVAAAIFTAENPSDHHIALSTVTGVRDFRASSSGIAFDTPRGVVEALIPEAFAQRTGEMVEATAGLRLRGLRLAVADIARAADASAGLAERRGRTLVVPSRNLAGLTLTLAEPG